METPLVHKTSFPGMGYYFFDNSFRGRERYKAIGISVTNVLGCIPLIQVVIGVIRAVYFVLQLPPNLTEEQLRDLSPEEKEAHKSLKAFCALQIGRGIGEILGFGTSLLLLDLFGTGYRQLTKKEISPDVVPQSPWTNRVVAALKIPSWWASAEEAATQD